MVPDIPASLRPSLSSHYPHRPRVLFLLRRERGTSEAAFELALTQWRADRPSGVARGSVLARAGVAIDEHQGDLRNRFAAAGADFTPYDGYASLDLESYDPSAEDFETVLAAATNCLHSLGAVLNRSESIARAGVANLVIPGQAPLAMILLLDRAPHLSIEQYNEWWTRHADDHRRKFLIHAGYHQLHVAPELDSRAAAAAGTSTTELSSTSIMYLARLNDAFAGSMVPGGKEERMMGADVAANVSLAKVGGGFFREV